MRRSRGPGRRGPGSDHALRLRARARRRGCRALRTAASTSSSTLRASRRTGVSVRVQRRLELRPSTCRGSRRAATAVACGFATATGSTKTVGAAPRARGRCRCGRRCCRARLRASCCAAAASRESCVVVRRVRALQVDELDRDDHERRRASRRSMTASRRATFGGLRDRDEPRRRDARARAGAGVPGAAAGPDASARPDATPVRGARRRRARPVPRPAGGAPGVGGVGAVIACAGVVGTTSGSGGGGCGQPAVRARACTDAPARGASGGGGSGCGSRRRARPAARPRSDGRRPGDASLTAAPTRCASPPAARAVAAVGAVGDAGRDAGHGDGAACPSPGTRPRPCRGAVIALRRLRCGRRRGARLVALPARSSIAAVEPVELQLALGHEHVHITTTSAATTMPTAHTRTIQRRRRSRRRRSVSTSCEVARPRPGRGAPACDAAGCDAGAAAVLMLTQAAPRRADARSTTRGFAAELGLARAGSACG